MKQLARYSASIVLILGALPDALFAGGTGVSSVPDVIGPIEAVIQADTTRAFILYRVPQERDYYANRDLEYLWSQLYASLGAPLVPSDPTVVNDLDRLGTAICFTQDNPFGFPMSDIQIAYDYLNLDLNTYNNSSNPASGPGFLVRQPGFATYLEADRNHIDTYIYYPGPSGDGPGLNNRAAVPSDFVSANEDPDTQGIAELVRHGNNLSLAGPLASQVGDTGPNRWTAPSGAANVGFVHEFQHRVNQIAPTRSTSEILSLVGEALTGPPSDPPRYDVPYTWNLFRSGEDCQSTATSNYAAWASFGAYLAYNFRGVDTTSTGRSDDLVWRWTHAGGTAHVVPQLGLRLQDSECAECANRTYFTGLAANDRLQLLIHNWRVANFLNNPAIADSQFYFPPQFGYDPITDTGNWQDIDPGAPDAINIEREVLLTSAALTDDVTFSGSPTNVLNPQYTHLMALEHYGADYWVVRSDTSLSSTDRDLIVRIEAEGDCRLRVMTTAIAYSEQDISGSPAKLWQHPEWAAVAVPTKWTDIEPGSPTVQGGSFEISIPDFGLTHKAVLIVVSTGQPATANQICSSNRVMPYRLSLAIRSGTGLSPNPFPMTSPSDAFTSLGPAWAPTGDSLAFMARPVGSGPVLISTRRLSGGPITTLVQPTQSKHQYRPDWSPRGDWIAFDQESTGTNCDILAYNTTTGQIRRLASSQEHEFAPAFSPNGQRLAYIKATPGGGTSHELHTVGIDGTNDVVVVGPHGTNMLSPRWAPDGRHLYFISTDSLYAVELDGHEVIPIAKAGPRFDSFDFPLGTGRLLAGERWTPLNCGAPGSSTNQRIVLRDTMALTSQPVFWRSNSVFIDPRWSLDGTRFAFASNFDRAGGQADVYVGQVSYNRAPSFTGLGDQTLTQGVPFQLQISATDPESQSIAYVCPSTYWPPGASFDPGTRTFSWPDPQPAGGEYFVVFRAIDPSGGVANRVVRYVVQSPGGSCPFVDTRTAAGWQEENSILGRSLSSSLGLDAYRLKTAPDVREGRIQLRIRENEREYTTLDHVRLLAVDRPADVRACAVGERMFLATRAPAHRVIKSSGQDVTKLVNGSGSYFWGSSGDTLLVEMTPPGTRGTFGASGSQEGGGGEGGMEGDPKEMELTSDREEDGSASSNAAATDAAVLASTGIIVEVPDGSGGWRQLAHYYPRRFRDEFVMDSLGSGPCRLIFVGTHRLHFVGRYVRSASAAEPQALTLLEARHSRLGEVATAVGASAGGTTLLTPGDTLALTFAATAIPAGMVRDYFLLSTGVYTSTVPLARESGGSPTPPPLPTRFALLQNRPNPFERTTAIRFELPVESPVRLEVFDPQGRSVAVLAEGAFPAGFHAVEWDRRDGRGIPARPGVYLYRLTAGAFRETRKLLISR